MKFIRDFFSPKASTVQQELSFDPQLARRMSTAEGEVAKLAEENARLREALKKLTLGWLYWPAARQPDPRVTMYESRTLDQIEAMAKEALKQS